MRLLFSGVLRLVSETLHFFYGECRDVFESVDGSEFFLVFFLSHGRLSFSFWSSPGGDRIVVRSEDASHSITINFVCWCQHQKTGKHFHFPVTVEFPTSFPHHLTGLGKKLEALIFYGSLRLVSPESLLPGFSGTTACGLYSFSMLSIYCKYWLASCSSLANDPANSGF